MTSLGIPQAAVALTAQQQTTSILKMANEQPKLALQLIPPVPKAIGNIGNNINVSV